MRRATSKWIDWVIALGILTIAVIGVAALWEDDIRVLFGGGVPTPAREEAQPSAEPVTAGPAKGPF